MMELIPELLELIVIISVMILGFLLLRRTVISIMIRDLDSVIIDMIEGIVGGAINGTEYQDVDRIADKILRDLIEMLPAKRKVFLHEEELRSYLRIRIRYRIMAMTRRIR